MSDGDGGRRRSRLPGRPFDGPTAGGDNLSREAEAKLAQSVRDSRFEFVHLARWAIDGLGSAAQICYTGGGRGLVRGFPGFAYNVEKLA